MEAVGTRLRAEASRKSIELVVVADEGARQTVLEQPTQLRKVILNLASNALQFTQHGRVTISVRSIALGRGDVQLRFQVRDTGIGIAAEGVASHPATPARRTSLTAFDGLGMGLAVSRKLASDMGGRITLDSEEGSGSCFTFEIRVDVPKDQPTRVSIQP